MAAKPSIPKGTRDFSPEEMAKRNYIFNTIREVYALYGFRQIETPAMENLSTLMGKYGEEGGNRVFYIQDTISRNLLYAFVLLSGRLTSVGRCSQKSLIRKPLAKSVALI